MLENAFKAFDHIRILNDYFLVIAITDGKTNMKALVEGGRLANLLGHRVVLLIMTDPNKIPTTYLNSDAE